jgi:hypothetical protein
VGVNTWPFPHFFRRARSPAPSRHFRILTSICRGVFVCRRIATCCCAIANCSSSEGLLLPFVIMHWDASHRATPPLTANAAARRQESKQGALRRTGSQRCTEGSRVALREAPRRVCRSTIFVTCSSFNSCDSDLRHELPRYFSSFVVVASFCGPCGWAPRAGSCFAPPSTRPVATGAVFRGNPWRVTRTSGDPLGARAVKARALRVNSQRREALLE